MLNVLFGSDVTIIEVVGKILALIGVILCIVLYKVITRHKYNKAARDLKETDGDEQ